MHPWYRHTWHYHRPSRLIWFVLGAASATIWARHKEMRDNRSHHYQCVRKHIQPSSSVEVTGSALPFYNPMAPEMPVNATEPHRHPFQRKWSWGHDEGDGTSGWNNQQWDEDKVRMKQLGKQAEEAMTEVSEATLDSILSTVQTLKSKLAEHRIQREQQQEFIREQLKQQEKKKDPPQSTA